ncbi:ABC transporter permease [Streptomyces sp. 71268]|uniref:ABC transporter permease n=1 Tax=Streptomyces sp. 71268 TaxID=3002640 RepID=UPI0023F63E41|nr:ABC transporter permease [Streptomyces sp. 71268]WEV25681.1 ABC transporter permease [Streptomyces sp. 71268]
MNPRSRTPDTADTADTRAGDALGASAANRTSGASVVDAGPGPGGKPRGLRGPLDLAGWVRDLGLGARFAVTGGRQGWTRTVLTAVGVGLGVALLLLAAAVPSILDNRRERGQARQVVNLSADLKAGPRTFLHAGGDTEWHGEDIVGSLLRAEGSRPPAPPGVSAMPRPGEMMVSPALRDLLRRDGNDVLRERFADYRIVGTIADEGLLGPAELVYLAGSDRLTEQNAQRTDHFGNDGEGEPMSAVLILLAVMVCVVLLMPVAIFVGTAVRFGGEQRDRRLAALRLVGADLRMTHRIAAGESLVGALLGLAVGCAIFLVGREFVGSVTVWDINVFPSDVAPHPTLAALIAVSVPACAVLVTLLALRGITIEPLGVVRGGAPRRRRLWWRLALPALGFGLLLPLVGGVSYQADTDLNTYQVAAGAVLVLVGVTALLPWLVEGFVNRFRGGPLSWQLAIRRLQLSSGTAARTVSGVTVAVAGAVAIQMLFAGVQDDFEKDTGHDANEPRIGFSRGVTDSADAVGTISAIRETPGARDVVARVRATIGKAGATDRKAENLQTVELFIADCASLRVYYDVGSCKDGDVFRSGLPSSSFAKPGAAVDVTPPGYGDTLEEHLWTVPATARTVAPRADAPDDVVEGIVATPSAVPIDDLADPWLVVDLNTDPAVRDSLERVRNTAIRTDPGAAVMVYASIERNERFEDIQTGLFVGATVTLLLIGASMVVTQLEQLRDRRRLLSVLVAFGARRSTLAYSVLWQTAIPVVIGLTLSLAGGAALGVVLLKMVDRPVQDWSALVPMVGIGAGVIALVTLVSLPPLWRMMRPDGLRTE